MKKVLGDVAVQLYEWLHTYTILNPKPKALESMSVKVLKLLRRAAFGSDLISNPCHRQMPGRQNAYPVQSLGPRIPENPFTHIMQNNLTTLSS